MQLRNAPAELSRDDRILERDVRRRRLSRVPAAIAARARAIDPSMSPGPSSMPGRTWQ
jgi:hypothetical protein